MSISQIAMISVALVGAMLNVSASRVEADAGINFGTNAPTRTGDGINRWPDEAQAHFDWLAKFVGIADPVSSAFTREAAGWQPREAGLLADMRASRYFA